MIFLSPFTVCSSCMWKFVVCQLVQEETRNCFANGLNRLNGLVHLSLSSQGILSNDILVLIDCVLFSLFTFYRMRAVFLLFNKIIHTVCCVLRTVSSFVFSFLPNGNQTVCCVLPIQQQKALCVVFSLSNTTRLCVVFSLSNTTRLCVVFSLSCRTRLCVVLFLSSRTRLCVVFSLSEALGCVSCTPCLVALGCVLCSPCPVAPGCVSCSPYLVALGCALCSP